MIYGCKRKSVPSSLARLKCEEVLANSSDMTVVRAPSTSSSSSSNRWCWVVALASFWTNFCLLGVLRSSAAIYVALVDTFGVSRETAAWPSGVFGFTMCLTGAFSGCIRQYFSIRSIMMVAATFAALSVSLCCYATHMQHIVVLYGAFQGIGIGMIVPLTHVILNEHFERQRAVAMGIAYAGSSAGSFVFPAVTQIMIVEYGLPGTFLLLGGIMLNSVLGISLFRDPPQPRSLTSATGNDVKKGKPDFQSEDLGERRQNPSRRICHIKKTHSWDFSGSDYIVYERDKRKQVLGTDAVQKMETTKKSEGYSFSDCTKKFRFSRDSLETLKKTVDLSFQVLSQPSFLMISLTFAVYFSASAIYLITIMDHALDLGHSESQSIFLVSTFSFGDLVGRLACGWIADLKYVERRYLVAGCLVTMGVILTVVPLCHVYQTLTALSVLLGILNGSIIVNYSAILTENLGLEKLAMAMGFSTFIIGSIAFLRPVAIGYFRDKSRRYDLLFVCLGALQICITLIWLLESTLRRKGLRKTTPHNDKEVKLIICRNGT